MSLVNFQEAPSVDSSPPVIEAPPPLPQATPLAHSPEPHWLDQGIVIVWSLAGILLVVLGLYQVV